MSFVFLFLSATTCQLDADCRGGFVCERSACVPAQAVGAPRVIFNVPSTPKANRTGEPPPPQPAIHPASIGLVAAGASVLATVSIFNWTVLVLLCQGQLGHCDGSVAVAAIPGFGPLILATQVRPDPLLTTLVVSDGLLQLGSIGMIVAGALLHRDPGGQVGPLHLSMLPMKAPGAAGLALVGRF